MVVVLSLSTGLELFTGGPRGASSFSTLEFEIRDKDLVGSDAMGSVQLSSSDFGEARWIDVAATKDCRDATGRIFVGCSVGTIVERAEDLPVKKKSWFGSSKKKEKAPVVTTAAVVDAPDGRGAK